MPVAVRQLLVLAMVGIILLLVALATAREWETVAGGAPAIVTDVPPAGSKASGPIPRETYRWRPVAIGGGGFITGLSWDAAGTTLVARTDVYGAYIWLPEEDRWAQLVTAESMPGNLRAPAAMATGVFGLAVAPSDGRRLYMVAGGGIFYSKDRGRSWTASEAPFPTRYDANSAFHFYDPVLAVAPDDPDLVLFGSPEDGLWRSINGGHSWARVASVPGARDLRRDRGQQAPGLPIWFEPGRTDHIWVASPGNGVFVSTDRGAHFAALATGTGPMLLQAGAFLPGGFIGTDPEQQTLWCFRQGHWIDLAAEGAVGRRRWGAIAINPRTAEIFAFDAGGYAVRSTDGGRRWATLLHRAVAGKNDPPWLHVADQSFFATAQARFDPVVRDRLWVAAGTGVFRADVHPGAPLIKWESQARGIEELVANDVVQPLGHAPLFAVLDFGIHVKSNLDVFSRTYGPRERVLIAAQQLALSPADWSFVATNASDTRRCCAEDGDAVMAGTSTDAGRSWRKFPTLPTPPGTDPADPWRMAYGMIAVASNDVRDIVWAPSFDHAPFSTRDGGKSWRRAVFAGERLPDTGDHPQQWIARKVLAADPVRPATFYFARSATRTNPQLAGLWRSDDGGARWIRLFAGELAGGSGGAAKLRAMPGRPGNLFYTAAASGFGDTRLRRSLDGGVTWQPFDNVEKVDDVAFGKPAQGSRTPTIFIAGYIDRRFGLWRSTDDARTWDRIATLPLGTLDQITVLGADPNVFGRVYVGYQGSGFIYGEPAPCRVAQPRAFIREECIAVGR